MATTLQQINKKLLQVNQQYEQVFNNPFAKRTHLTKKEFSLLFQKIYAFAQSGSHDTKLQHKQLLLTLAKTYLRNFLHSHVGVGLVKIQHQQDFEYALSQKWNHFKQFTFYYYALLQPYNQSYETAYLTAVQKSIQTSINNEASIFPIAVVALNYFKTMILDEFKQKIQHIVLQRIKSHRGDQLQKGQPVKNILEFGAAGWQNWPGLEQSPAAEKNDFLAKVKPSRNPELFFAQTLHNKILLQTETHYNHLYESKIVSLLPIEQFQVIDFLLAKQFSFSQEFFPTHRQQKNYMAKIYDQLTRDLPQRLAAPNSLKSLIENYKHPQEDTFLQIKLFFQVLKHANKISHHKFKQILQTLQTLLTDIILQQGQQINLKINKRRQYITDMLTLKKSIDHILEQLTNKNILLFSSKDKAFKKILDSIEAARNLADHTDFTIKQCIRLKLDQERSLDKFADVFLLLNSLTSTDSFLLYHQELMGRRIVESLNEPKLEYELLMLKKLSEKMGVMSVGSHMTMIKEMEQSQEVTEKYNNRLAFSSFKWSLKIFNPSFWPQSISRQKLSIEFPNQLFHQARAIEQLYHGQNKYRYLQWKLQKGTSLFEGRFGGKKVRFQSENSYLMVLLLIAEQSENRVIYGNLKQLVRAQKVSEQSMTKHDPLAMLVYVLIENRLVVRRSIEDRYAAFSQSEELEINKNYSVGQNVGKGQPVVVIRPSQEMSKNLQQSSIQKGKIMKDREKLIEAILVKVLKHAHATKDNSVSFSELYQAIKDHPILGGFNFSEGTVKQKLEELIARQFCFRDQDDRKVYHYVA